MPGPEPMDLTALATQIADSYQPPHTGRHSVLNDADILSELLTAIRSGLGRDAACQLVDISPRTLSRILERGEAGEEPHARFVHALKREEARCELDIVKNVIKASEKPQFWAAGMTYLERKYPDRWGRRPEDSSAPRVIVQVGGQASDVKVLIQGSEPPLSPSPFASDPGRKPDANSLSPQTYAVPSCPITAVMVTPHDPVPHAQDVAGPPAGGAGFAGAGRAVPGAPPRAGGSQGKARRVRGRAAKDVRARRRRAVKKTPEETT